VIDNRLRGERLRRIRETRGITLDQVAQVTKINHRYLSALEEGEIHKLPGGIFNREFVRAYAEYIGADKVDEVADHVTVTRTQLERLEEAKATAARLNSARISLHLATRVEKDDDDKPPKAAKFLLLLVPGKNRDYLAGDLEERYRTILVPEFGVRKAQFWYWWHVFISLAPFVWEATKRLVSATFLWKITR
jgi:transcriptional regulator with XRE-family HTH domain